MPATNASVNIIIFILELIFLFLLSRRVIQALYFFFYVLFRSRSVAVSAVSLVFFPGTVIHELSHLFSAEVLGVRTGKLTLVPESIEKEDIRTGSVEISQTDPLRRTLIGIAPLFGGTIGLVLCAAFLATLSSQLVASHTSWVHNPSFYLLALLLYLIFSISNSLFSSKEDLAGVVPFLICLILLVAAAYVSGIGIQLTGKALEIATEVSQQLVSTLVFVLVINGILLLVIRLLIDLIGKSSKSK